MSISGQHELDVDGIDLAPRQAPRFRAWVIAIVVMLSAVVVFLDKILLGLAAEPMRDDLGLSASGLGSLAGASYLLFGVTCLIVTFSAQRISPRWVFLACGLVWACGQLPAIFAVSATMIYASRFVVGAAEGPANPLALTSMYSWFPNDRRGTPTALYTSGASVAKIALAPVLTLVIIGFGWRAGFVTVFAMALAWALLWLLVGRIGPYGTAPAPRKPGVPAARVPWRKALLNRTFVGGLVAYLTQNAFAAVIFTWLPSYFHQGLGFSTVVSGSLFGLPSAAGIVALFATGFTADRMLRRGVRSRRARGLFGGVVLVVSGLVLTVLPWVHTPVLAIVILMLGYGGSVTVNTFANPAVTEIVPAQQRPALLGVLSGIGISAGAVTPFLTGYLVDHAATPQQGYTTAFLLCGVLLVVGGLCFGAMVNPERDTWHRDAGTPHRDTIK